MAVAQTDRDNQWSAGQSMTLSLGPFWTLNSQDGVSFQVNNEGDFSAALGNFVVGTDGAVVCASDITAAGFHGDYFQKSTGPLALTGSRSSGEALRNLIALLVGLQTIADHTTP